MAIKMMSSWWPNWMWYEWMIWTEINEQTNDEEHDDERIRWIPPRETIICVRFESTMRYNWLLSTVSDFCFTCQSVSKHGKAKHSTVQVFGAIASAHRHTQLLQQGDTLLNCTSYDLFRSRCCRCRCRRCHVRNSLSLSLCCAWNCNSSDGINRLRYAWECALSLSPWKSEVRTIIEC